MDDKKILTLQEILQTLKANGWHIAAVFNETGIKQSILYRMMGGFYKNTSYQRYLMLVNLLTKKPPAKAPYRTAQYLKGFADGVASVKGSKHG